MIRKFFSIFYSLKLAILVIVSLACSLAAGTIVESIYDTKTAQFYVYRAGWFKVVLGVLAINILSVMVSRWPWRPRHAPFLLAHIGILTLLFGAVLTDRYGLDGNMRVAEGKSTRLVDVDAAVLVLSEGDWVRYLEVPWRPPSAGFQPIPLTKLGLPAEFSIQEYLSHADARHSFHARESGQAAVRIRMTGGAMNLSQEFWLWAGAPEWSATRAGPALLALGKDPGGPPGKPKLVIQPQADGGLRFEARASGDGKTTQRRFKAGQVAGQTIDPGWKGVKITFVEWIPSAGLKSTYVPAREQYGDTAPTPALRLVSSTTGADIWLGLGERTLLRTAGRVIDVGFARKRFVLPFAVRLDRFSIENYEGSAKPTSFSSRVTIIADSQKGEDGTVRLGMNEPVTREGVTLYQASYEDAQPRPVTSIFSVNRDPGRPWKYTGSLLLVLGTILLFAMKYVKKRKQAAWYLATPPKSTEAFS